MGTPETTFADRAAHLRDWLRVIPPLTVTAQELEEGLTILEDVVRSLAD